MARDATPLEADILGAHVSVEDNGSVSGRLEVDLSGELPDEVAPDVALVGERDDSVVLEFPHPDEQDHIIRSMLSDEEYQECFEALNHIRHLLADHTIAYFAQFCRASVAVEEHGDTEAMETFLETLFKEDALEYEVTVESVATPVDEDDG